MKNFEEKLKIENIAELSEIPTNILGITLTESERINLSKGLYSNMHENLSIDEKTTTAGKFKFVRDEKNELKLHIVYKKEKLIIPEEFEFAGIKRKLRKDEIESLLKNESICLEFGNKEDIYMKIDKETNNIIFTNTKTTGIPDEIGGYKLTVSDKAKLEMGQSITKLFNNNNKHFISTVSITDDSMIFSNSHYVEKKDVKQKREELNNSTQKVEKNKNKFFNINKQNIKKINDIPKEQNFILNKYDKINIKNSSNLSDKEKSIIILKSEFYESMNNKDLKKLDKIQKEQNFILTEEDKNFIKNSNNLSEKEKNNIIEKSEFYQAVNENDFEKLNKLQQESNLFLTEDDKIYIRNSNNLSDEEKNIIITKFEFYQAINEKDFEKLIEIPKHEHFVLLEEDKNFINNSNNLLNEEKIELIARSEFYQAVIKKDFKKIDVIQKENNFKLIKEDKNFINNSSNFSDEEKKYTLIRSEFIQAIYEKDLKKINELRKEQNFILTEEDKNFINNSSNLSQEEKNVIVSTLEAINTVIDENFEQIDDIIKKEQNFIFPDETINIIKKSKNLSEKYKSTLISKSEFYQALNNKDFDKLENLPKNQNYILTEEDKSFIHNSSNLSQEEKTSILTKFEFHKTVSEKELKKLEELKKEQNFILSEEDKNFINNSKNLSDKEKSIIITKSEFLAAIKNKNFKKLEDLQKEQNFELSEEDKNFINNSNNLSEKEKNGIIAKSQFIKAINEKNFKKIDEFQNKPNFELSEEDKNFIKNSNNLSEKEKNNIIIKSDFRQAINEKDFEKIDIVQKEKNYILTEEDKNYINKSNVLSIKEKTTIFKRAEFLQSIYEKDLKKINELRKEPDFVLSDDDKKFINNSNNLSLEEKKLIVSTLEKVYTVIDEKKNIEENQKEQNFILSEEDKNFIKNSNNLSENEKNIILTRSDFFEAIENKNFKKFKEFKNNNFSLTEEDKNYIKNSKNLSDEEKTVIITTFEDENSIKIGSKKGIENNKDNVKDNIKEKVDEKVKSKPKNPKIERIITNAFSDM